MSACEHDLVGLAGRAPPIVPRSRTLRLLSRLVTVIVALNGTSLCVARVARSIDRLNERDAAGSTIVPAPVPIAAAGPRRADVPARCRSRSVSRARSGVARAVDGRRRRRRRRCRPVADGPTTAVPVGRAASSAVPVEQEGSGHEDHGDGERQCDPPSLRVVVVHQWSPARRHVWPGPDAAARQGRPGYGRGLGTRSRSRRGRETPLRRWPWWRRRPRRPARRADRR